jgi:hypothetical protein
MPSDKPSRPCPSLARADDQPIFHADGDASVMLGKIFCRARTNNVHYM